MGIKKLAVTLLVLLLASAVWAQTGEKFHEVQTGETKYGISRQYNITIETLEQYNPDIKDGLRAGIKLLIPENAPVAKDRNAELARDSGYVYHLVESGHTLFSLARDYGSTIALIKEANPQIEQGLQVGKRIKIPLQTPSAAEPEKGKYYMHTVQARETAFSLSRFYKLSLDSLYALNPSAREGLRIGQKLRIPRAKVPKIPVPQEVAAEPEKEVEKSKPQEQLSADDQEERRPLNDDYFLYKVKTGDSFYSFKQKFGVEREELIRLNPELVDGLKVGNYIILPKRVKQEELSWLEKLFAQEQPEKKIGPVQESTQNVKDSLNIPREVPVEPVIIDTDTATVDLTKTYRIALLLPFESEKLDSMDHYDLTLSPVSEMSLQFYQGFLVAADSLSQSGMNLSLKVYDTHNSLFTVKKLTSELKAFAPDLVVGPAFKEHVEYVADAFKEDQVPVISPLSMSVSVEGRDNLIQIIPDKTSRLARIADIVNQRFQNAKVLFVHTGKEEELNQVQTINSRLQPRSDSSFISTAVVPEESLANQNQLRALLNPKGRTAVVLLGDDVVFLNDVVAKLHNLRDSSITLIGSSRMLSMSTLENEYLNRLKLTMTDIRHADYTHEATKNFVGKYREEFKSEPSGFSMQGYDIGLFFLERLWKSGIYFHQNLAGEEVKTATGYNINKVADGGYMNNFLFVTGIRNFELVRIPMDKQDSLQPLTTPELELEKPRQAQSEK